jgi:N-acyl-D-aspartate/D-glutamate deacylase
MSDPPNYEPNPECSIARRAADSGVSPESIAYDLLVADGGRALIYVPFSNYAYGSLDDVREMLTHEFTLPGLSDGGAHVGTICDASFSTTLLEYWVRDRTHGPLSLPFVIKRQARDTACAVGLFDRGQIKEGYKADINVIDMDALRLHAPYVAHDLPGGARRLLQTADGFCHTIVSGAETYRDGVATDELPGRLVRGAQHKK